MPVLRRNRALVRSHRGTLLLIAVLVVVAGYGVLQLVATGGDHDLPLVLDTLSTGLRWAWTVIAGLSGVVIVLLVVAEWSWLTGRTEVTGRGIVLRSGRHETTVGWVDIDELRAVPASGGHLYHLRTAVPMPRPPRLGLQGRREAWIGWHPGGDAPVAAVARAHLGVKYRRQATTSTR